MLVLLDRDWGGGRCRPPSQTKIFSHQCGGHLQPVGGLNPQPPPPDKSNAGSDGHDDGNDGGESALRTDQ